VDDIDIISCRCTQLPSSTRLSATHSTSSYKAPFSPELSRRSDSDSDSVHKDHPYQSLRLKRSNQPILDPCLEGIAIAAGIMSDQCISGQHQYSPYNFLGLCCWLLNARKCTARALPRASTSFICTFCEVSELAMMSACHEANPRGKVTWHNSRA